MNGPVHISEAANLALHTMILLAGDPGRRRSVKDIAARLEVSEDHLAKVLQRLVHARLLGASRGPRGGYLLEADPAQLPLLQILELIDGPMAGGGCLLARGVCTGSCGLGELLQRQREELRNQLATTCLADVAGALKTRAKLAPAKIHKTHNQRRTP